MRKLLLPLAASLLLTACAAPLPFQIASWAIDGLSYLATGKSVADHGISLIAQKDCALWRTVKGEAVCTDPPADDAVAVAEVEAEDDGETDLIVDPIEVAAAIESVEAPEAPESLKSRDPGPAPFGSEPFEAPAPAPASLLVARPGAPVERPVLTIGTVIAGDDVQVASLAARATPLAAPVPAAAGQVVDWTLMRAMADESDDDLSMVVKVDLKTITDEAAAPSTEDFYYVIGSFRGAANARVLAAEQAAFDAKVVVGRGGDGRIRHRVVVGPLPKDLRPPMRRRIVAAGIADVWVIRMAAPAIVARADGVSGNG